MSSTIVVIDRSGQEHVLDANPGHTVMEIIRDGGVDELLALCGGCLSCATCHVHVDPVVAGLLPAMSEDERDLLESSNHCDERSRLSCQLPMNDVLAGLRVTIAVDD